MGYAELACQNLPHRDPAPNVPAHAFQHIAAWQEARRIARLSVKRTLPGYTLDPLRGVV